MTYSIPDAIAALKAALRGNPDAAAQFEILAADYRSADAARDSYDAKFQMLEDAGIDVVTLLERIERGSVTSAAEGSA